MAMEKIQVIPDTHTRTITSLGYNPVRHELLAGCEDGVIKVWDYSTGEPGKLLRSSHEHDGWVTCFLFWSDAKLILSASNDGSILAWGSGFSPHGRVQVPAPVYCMCWNSRREQLIVGVSAAIRVYTLEDPSNSKDPGRFLSEKALVIKDHTDIVKSIVCHETRIYSAGYDRKLIIYDSYSYPGKRGLKCVSCVYPAHDAGINNLVLARDTENNTWLLSGGFDKTVKVWSQDGQLMHKFDSLSSTVTGLCYVRPTKTIWIAAGTPEAFMFDPKSGDNVSEFIGTFQNSNDPERSELILLQYISDLGQVFGTNARRQILTWKYNPSGCITTLKSRYTAESLTYTKKGPDTFLFRRQRRANYKVGEIAVKYLHVQADQDAQANIGLLCSLFVEDLDLLIVSSEDHNIYVWGFDDDAVQVLENMRPTDDLTKKYGILLDQKDSKLPVQTKEKDVPNGQDSVTNRVAGFICKHVFTEHTQVVTALTLIGREAGYSSTYLLSTGWDRRIYLWDLEALCLHDTFRNTQNDSFEHFEIAADGIILDMAYSLKRNEFAYSASDKLVYIRRFSTDGAEMTLAAVLQGHEAEVTQVQWHSKHDKWVTGSEDGTIRLWTKPSQFSDKGLFDAQKNANGMTCDLVLNTHGSVSALCIDSITGCLVAGVQDTIKVYDPELRSIVQTNIGHTDAVRCIIHIPDRQQYISASWDKTVRIWNAYKKTHSLTSLEFKISDIDPKRKSTKLSNKETIVEGIS